MALVLEFCDSNDISWQVPGKEDFIIIRAVDQDGKKSKQTKQLRYMLMSLKGFSFFCETHLLKLDYPSFVIYALDTLKPLIIYHTMFVYVLIIKTSNYFLRLFMGIPTYH